MRKAISAILTAAMLLTFVFAAPLTVQAAETCMIKVELQQVGKPSSVSIQINGNFLLGATGAALPSGDYTITNSGGSLLLSGNGVSQSMGASFLIQEGQNNTGRNYTYVRESRNSYLGSMAFHASGSGVMVVNHVFIEDYLIGVVRREMNNNYPIEALKAQAVAARTYVYRSIQGSASNAVRHIGDGESDQVYYGYNSTETNVIRAVQDTAGQILYSGGTLHYTYYSASNGGQIETIANRYPDRVRAPYSIMKDDPYDYSNPESPVHRLTIPKSGGIGNYPLEEVLRARMGDSYANIAGVQSITLSNPRTTNASEGSRYYRTMTFTLLVGGSSYTPPAGGSTGGSSGGGSLGGKGSLGGGYLFNRTWDIGSSYSGDLRTVTVDINTQSDLINIISPSLRLSLFEVKDNGSSFVIEARRYGHGVGMSQRGAQQMGREGKTYRDILSFYYTNSTLEQREFVASALPGSGGIWDGGGAVDPGQGGSSTAIGTGIVSASSLNVRASASSSADRIGSLPNGSSVTILAESGDFYAIQYGNTTGYVAKAYVRATITGPSGDTGGTGGTTDGGNTAARTGTVTLESASSNLNVRSGPGTSHSLVTSIRNGTKVNVTGTAGDWSAIQVPNGPSGYVMSRYIVMDSTAGNTGGTGGGGLFDAEPSNPGAVTTTPPSSTPTPPPVVIPGYSGSLGSGTVITPVPTPSPTPYSSGDMWSVGGATAAPTATPAPTAAPSASTGTIKTAGGKATLRSEASTSSAAIAMMNSGLLVTVHGYSGDWYKITASASYSGWVHKDYIAVTGTVPNLGTSSSGGGTVAGTQATVVLASASSSLNIRSGPGTEHASAGFLRHGDAITVGAATGDWVAITKGNINGYIKKQYISTYAGTSGGTAAPATSTATVKLSSAGSTLNVRSGPGTTFAPVISVQHGAVVTVLGTSGEWTEIQTAGNAKGYVKSSYLSSGTSSGTSSTGSSSSVTTTGNVHLREKADRTSTSLGVIPSGTKLTVASKGAEFSQVSYNGKTGYVSNQYIK